MLYDKVGRLYSKLLIYYSEKIKKDPVLLDIYFELKLIKFIYFIVLLYSYLRKIHTIVNLS